MALSVPLSRFTSRVGGGSAFFVRQHPRTMNIARIIVAVAGILLPYLVRLPRGLDWAGQYTDTGFLGFAFFSAFNAIAWGSIIAVSFLYRRIISLIFPAVFGFGFLAWAHYGLDLRADAQAAIALVFIPIYSLVFIAVGGFFGFVVDRFLRRYDAA